MKRGFLCAGGVGPNVSINPSYKKVRVPPIKTLPNVLGLTPKDEKNSLDFTIEEQRKNKRHDAFVQGSLTCASAILY